MHYSFNSLSPRDALMRLQINQHWFRQRLVAWTAPSNYLDQCLNIVNSTLRNKFQWNLNRNFFHENAFENVVWKMSTILSRPQCGKHWLDVEYMTIIFTNDDSFGQPICASLAKEGNSILQYKPNDCGRLTKQLLDCLLYRSSQTGINSIL